MGCAFSSPHNTTNKLLTIAAFWSLSIVMIFLAQYTVMSDMAVPRVCRRIAGLAILLFTLLQGCGDAGLEVGRTWVSASSRAALDAAPTDLEHGVLLAAAHEVVLELEPAGRGADLGTHLVVGHGQQVCRHLEVGAELGGRCAQGEEIGR